MTPIDEAALKADPSDSEIMEIAGRWFHTGENQHRADGYYYRSLGTPTNVRGSDLIAFARALLHRSQDHIADAGEKVDPSAQGPAELFLQLHGDCQEHELTEPVDYTNDEVTWCWHRIHESDVRYVRADTDMQAEIDRMSDALREIGDFAHDRSTGPAVPDALWEVRSMAYSAESNITSPQHQVKKGESS